MNSNAIWRNRAAVILAAGIASGAQAGVVTSKGADIVIDTTGGLKIATIDKQFSFKLAGRGMWDFDSYDGALTKDGDRIHGGDLRRARLELSGTFYQDWQYMFAVNVGQDNSDGGANFNNIGIKYTGYEWGSIFIGRDKEPFGLEELISSKSISTIERAYWVEATDVDSQPNYGVRLDGFTNAGLGWAAAVNNPKGGPTDDGGDEDGDGDGDGQENFAFTGRVFFAPWAEPGEVLHFGAAYTDRGLSDATSKEQKGFKLDIAEHDGKLDSQGIIIDDDQQWDIEALWINGPLSLQAEYFHRDMKGAGKDEATDAEVDAYYVQLTYTLTGEARGYKRKKGYADIIKPAQRTGAWELVAKYDYIEFELDGADKEEAEGLLLGLNYYPNKNLKFMANYINFSSDNVVSRSANSVNTEDDADVFSLRAQFSF